MYAKLLKDGAIQAPYYLKDLQRDNPNTSFPSTLTAEVLATFNAVPVVETTPPEVDRSINQLTYEVLLQNGEYKQVWAVTPLAEDLAAQRVRDIRDGKLKATDWTQIPDATVDKVAWAAYRQSLRDVPQQPGFPHSVTWPSEPTGT